MGTKLQGLLEAYRAADSSEAGEAMRAVLTKLRVFEDEIRATHISLPALREHVAAYLFTQEDNEGDRTEWVVTDRELSEVGTGGLLEHLERVVAISPEFVSMDAIRYRLFAGALLADVKGLALTPQQCKVRDVLSHVQDVADVNELSRLIDEAMK